MEQLILVFLGLLIIIFIGQTIYKEGFDSLAPQTPRGVISVLGGAPASVVGSSGTDHTWHLSRDLNSSDTAVLTVIPTANGGSGANGGNNGGGDGGGGGGGCGCDDDCYHDCDDNGLSISDLLALADTSGQQMNYSHTSWTVPHPSPRIYMMDGYGDKCHKNRHRKHHKFPGLTYHDDHIHEHYRHNYQQDINNVPHDHTHYNTDTPFVKQGTDYIKYAPALNPADYIRKDSIPCYGCTL